MKKVFILLFALICFGATSKAQVCKISDSNDSVEVFGSYIDVANNQIIVTVGNDSNDISANVTITVTVTVSTGANSMYEKTFTGKAIAKPNTTTPINVKPTNGYQLKNNSTIKDIKISGTKCA